MGDDGHYIPHVQLLTLIDAQDGLIASHKVAREALRQEVKAGKVRVARVEKVIARAEARVQELDNARRDHERQLQDLERRITHTAAMDGVHNQKEYEAAEAALVSLRAQKGDAEEAALTEMMELDELRPKVASLKKDLKVEVARYGAIRARAKAAFDEHGEALQKVREEREEYISELASLDPVVMRRYDSLMRRHGERAALVAANDQCGFCHISVSPQHILEARLGRALHYCDHCGRFILPPAPVSAQQGGP